MGAVEPGRNATSNRLLGVAGTSDSGGLRVPRGNSFPLSDGLPPPDLSATHTQGWPLTALQGTRIRRRRIASSCGSLSHNAWMRFWSFRQGFGASHLRLGSAQGVGFGRCHPRPVLGRPGAARFRVGGRVGGGVGWVGCGEVWTNRWGCGVGWVGGGGVAKVGWVGVRGGWVRGCWWRKGACLCVCV